MIPLYRIIRKVKKGFRKQEPAIIIVEGEWYFQGDLLDVADMISREMRKDWHLADLIDLCSVLKEKGVTLDEVFRAKEAGELA